MQSWQRTLYIISFAQLMTGLGFSVIFPFLPLYIEELGTRTSISLEIWAGLVYSAQAFAMMIAAPIWGALADRHGRKLMVVRSMFGGMVLIFLMAFARSAEELVLIRIFQGMVTGTFSASNALVAAAAPRARSGYALGVLQIAMWFGISVGPLVGGTLADAFGFRVPFFVTTALLGLSGVLVVFGVHEDFSAVETDRPQRGMLGEWRNLLVSPGIGLTLTMRFLSRLSQTMIIPIAPLFVQLLLPEGGQVSSMTGLIVGVSAATGTATAVYLGRLGDRIGHRRVLMVSALAAALFYLPQSLVASAWQLLVLQALTGAAFGGVFPIIGALLAQYVEQGGEGAIYGLDNSVFGAARTISPMVGVSMAVWIGLRPTFAIAGVLLLTVAILARFFLPEVRVAQRV